VNHKKGEKMKKYWLFVAVVVLGACGVGKNKEVQLAAGEAEVSVALTLAQLTRVACVVSGSGMSDMTVDLTLSDSNSKAAGLIAQIPAGSARLFTVNAYRGLDIVCTGTATTDITANARAQVSIVLQCTPDPENLGEAQISGTFNFPPRINTAVASGSTVAPSGTVTFTVTASDPDSDPIAYGWTASGGTFSNATTASTVWTAPASTGTKTVTITVSDNRGGSTTLSVNISVGSNSSCAYAIDLAGPSIGGVSITDVPSLNPGTDSWTVEFFARIDIPNIILLTKNSSAENNMYLVGVANGGKIYFHFGDGGSQTSFGESTNTFVDGLTHHVAVVRNTSMPQIRLYVDGNLEASTVDSEVNIAPVSPLRFGRNQNMTPVSDAMIDEVRIWRAAKYSANFSPLRCSSPADRTNLVGEWKFEEGAGTSVADTSGNGNNGTLSGDFSWVVTP